MPDFTNIPMQQCKDISLRTVRVKSSKGDKVYVVTRIRGWEFTDCTCRGFKYRGTCKHLAMGQSKVCEWHELTGDEQVEAGVCPECGGETETVLVAV